MNPKEIEQKLAKMMNEIPEIEGLIAFDTNGKIISGQTLTETDKKRLGALSVEVYRKAFELGAEIDKKDINTINISTKNGYVIIESSSKFSILALLGKDAFASMSLVVRSLKNIINTGD